MEGIVVKAAPSDYRCDIGILEELEDILLEHDLSKILIVHGEKSLAAANRYLPAFSQVEATYVRYNKRCSLSEIEHFAREAERLQVDAVVGVGGGKVLDLTKGAAHFSKKEAVLIPTLAATCAAWASLSVIYDNENRFDHSMFFPKATRIVLVEPRIIAESPVEYLRAGIGDTLAKWYESRALTDHLDNKRLTVRIALEAAKFSREVLLEEGEAALAALERQELTDEVINVAETNILAGGLVGGFGHRFGRVAAAHTIHNALTQFTETHHKLHGEKVAYGVLLQLVLEKKEEDLRDLLKYYEKLQLPSSLAELGLNSEDEAMLDKLTGDILRKGEYIHSMQQSFTPRDVKEAIRKLEAIA